MLNGFGFYEFMEILTNISRILLKVANHENISSEENELLKKYSNEVYMSRVSSSVVEDLEDSLDEGYERKSESGFYW